MDPKTIPEGLTPELQAAADYRNEVFPWVVKFHAIMSALTARFKESRTPFTLTVVLRGVTYDVLLGPATHGFFLDLTRNSNRGTFLPERATLLLSPDYLVRVTNDNRYVNGERGDQPLQPYLSTSQETEFALRNIRRWTDPLIEELYEKLLLKKS